MITFYLIGVAVNLFYIWRECEKYPDSYILIAALWPLFMVIVFVPYLMLIGEIYLFIKSKVKK